MATLSDEDPLYFRLLDLHQAVGLILLTLFFIRLGWGLVTTYPIQLASLSGWERRLATMVHKIMLLILVLNPLSGYLFVTAQGDEVNIYDVFEIPAVMTLTQTVADWVMVLHMGVAYVMTVIVGLHTAAAFKHEWIDKYPVVRRMWW